MSEILWHRTNAMTEDRLPRRSNRSHRYGVILSGGDGVRLRPLTRLLTGDNRPKQFCRLLGADTLLKQTRDRVAGIVTPDRTLFVLTRTHEPFYAPELIDAPADSMVVQPCNRGTLPGILWTLIRLVRRDPEAVVAFFPSDHYYVNEGKFIEEVASAFEAAESIREVILLGASPTSPEADYGWIEPDRRTEGSKLLQVKCFWEKPSPAIAARLLDQGCLWNTFVMAGRAEYFLEMIQSAASRLYETFVAGVTPDEADNSRERMREVYTGIETADFSKLVLSKTTHRLAVLRLGEVGWDDLGDPKRTAAIRYRVHPQKSTNRVPLRDRPTLAATG